MTPCLLPCSNPSRSEYHFSEWHVDDVERATSWGRWPARTFRLLLSGLLLICLGVWCPTTWAQADSAKKAVAPVASPSDQAAPVAAKKTAVAQVKKTAATSSLSRETVLISSLTIFVLAIFVGFEVITKVPPTLHTPLMSGSNAISGITIVGAIIITGQATRFGALSIGFLAVVFATINVVGGFLVTHRMLSMFKKR